MAYSEQLAERVRGFLTHEEGYSERKMFGGICFMLHGNMCCGVVNDDLMARVGPDQYDECLSLPGARMMDFTGRPMKGMLYVGEEGMNTSAKLDDWVRRSMKFVRTLPKK
jgi:TfoX/Sxy family transcriptional regulator of competence genes